MSTRDRVKLLFGPYRPPKLKAGDRAFCLLRDCDVVVTSWTDAPIPWPRCRALGTHGGGSGLLLDEELARAVRRESSQAVQCWWGVTAGVVWRWRRALGVRQWEPEGSRRLHQEASERGAAAMRERDFSDQDREERRRRARELGLARYLPTGYRGPRWTVEEVALLGTVPDGEIARRIGRTAEAVRLRRQRLGVPNPAARPGAYGAPDWTDKEDRLVRTLPPREAARRTGRTLYAVYGRRRLLGLTPSFPRRRT